MSYSEHVTSIDTGAVDADAMAADAIGASEFAQGAADKVWASASRSVTDKAGFSLSAGSYSIRASSMQHVSGIMGSTTATYFNVTISAVTLARAMMSYWGENSSASAALIGSFQFTSTTNIQWFRQGGAAIAQKTARAGIQELF